MAERGSISGRQAAKRLGVSEKALRKWKARGDWVFGDPPYTERQVDQIELWAHRTLRKRPARRAVGRGAGVVPLVGPGARNGDRGSRIGDRGEPLRLAGNGDRRSAMPGSGSEDENGVEQELAELSDGELETLLRQLVSDVKKRNLDPGLRADVLLKVEKIQSERQRRAIAAGEYVKREDVQRRNIAKVHAVRQAHEQLGWTLAPLLLGLEDLDEIAAIIDERLRAIDAEFAHGRDIGTDGRGEA